MLYKLLKMAKDVNLDNFMQVMSLDNTREKYKMFVRLGFCRLEMVRRLVQKTRGIVDWTLGGGQGVYRGRQGRRCQLMCRVPGEDSEACDVAEKEPSKIECQES